MKLLPVVVAVMLALLGGAASVAAASRSAPRARLETSSRGFSPRADARTRGAVTLLSVRLAGLGSAVRSPRGPFRTRPTKVAFDLGGYYGASTKGLWIDHLRWVDWGKPVAFASGLVHARVWPSKNFITTPGGITIDQLRSCGTGRSYYTYASMLVPAGFPQNTEATATAISEQALTPC